MPDLLGTSEVVAAASDTLTMVVLYSGVFANYPTDKECAHVPASVVGTCINYLDAR